MRNYKLMIFALLLTSGFAFAQEEEETDPGGFGTGDPATEPYQTPIDSITLPLIITGVLTAVYFIRRKQKEVLQ